MIPLPSLTGGRSREHSRLAKASVENIIKFNGQVSAWNGLFPWKLQILGSYFHLMYTLTPNILLHICRVTTVYWPAKINKSQIYLFQLELWDSGETATRKYNHILPVLLWTFLSLMFTQVPYLILIPSLLRWWGRTLQFLSTFSHSRINLLMMI